MVTNYGNVKQILAFVHPAVSLSVQVNDTGVTADAQTGKKILLAGTPIGGAIKAIDDETAVLSSVSDDTVQGVLLHDVDVTSGQANGTMLIFGFVNLNRLDTAVVVPDAVKTALDGKVTFLKRN